MRAHNCIVLESPVKSTGNNGYISAPIEARPFPTEVPIIDAPFTDHENDQYHIQQLFKDKNAACNRTVTSRRVVVDRVVP